MELGFRRGGAAHSAIGYLCWFWPTTNLFYAFWAELLPHTKGDKNSRWSGFAQDIKNCFSIWPNLSTIGFNYLYSVLLTQVPFKFGVHWRVRGQRVYYNCFFSTLVSHSPLVFGFFRHTFRAEVFLTFLRYICRSTFAFFLWLPTVLESKIFGKRQFCLIHERVRPSVPRSLPSLGATNCVKQVVWAKDGRQKPIKNSQELDGRKAAKIDKCACRIEKIYTAHGCRLPSVAHSSALCIFINTII